MLQSGGQNQKWPTTGLGGYITPANLGVPNASGRGTKVEVAHNLAGWLHIPAALGVHNTSERRRTSEVARKWGGWLQNPCRLGGPQRFIAGDNITSGTQVGQVAT